RQSALGGTRRPRRPACICPFKEWSLRVGAECPSRRTGHTGDLERFFQHVSEQSFRLILSDRDAQAANKTAELGMWVDQVEHGSANEFSRMSEEELRAFIARQDEQLATLNNELATHAANGRSTH